MTETVSATEEIIWNPPPPPREGKMFVLRTSGSSVPEVTIIILNAAILPDTGIAHHYNMGLWNKPAGNPAFIAVFSSFGIAY
jgi:hypothetical protein